MLTLNGQKRLIPTAAKGSRRWWTLLSGLWATGEADIMDYVLQRPYGVIGDLSGALVQPYDGVFVRVPPRTSMRRAHG